VGSEKNEKKNDVFCTMKFHKALMTMMHGSLQIDHEKIWSGNFFVDGPKNI